MKKYFKLYRANYEKVTIFNLCIIFVLSIITAVLKFAIFNWLVAFAITLFIPITILNVAVLQFDLYEFFERNFKELKP